MTDKPLAHSWTIERRHFLWLVILAVGFFLLVPRMIGYSHLLQILRIAQPGCLALAVSTEILRYFVSAASTIVLARMFQVEVPFAPLVGAFFAGAAANRTYSTGGAPGMLVRFSFLSRRGVHAGAVAVIFLIEDIIGGVIGFVVLLIGIAALMNALPSGAYIADISVLVGVASPLFLLVGLYIYRRRPWVERIVQRAAQVLNRPLEWMVGHPVFVPSQVQQALNDFYLGMSKARHSPMSVMAAVLFNVIRYVGGAAALYFAFLCVGWTISLGALILVFTSVSLLSSVSAVPGEMAIMTSSFALLSLAFGVPADLALLALLLSRAIAFWLPLPLGYGALWYLRRKNEL